ncbi:MAG TPA: hypothetical protein PKE66_01125 [Pyrinomonadaceae bacterium]|nr:hypothetical protein [Pyrinomonadaceae bacterium]
MMRNVRPLFRTTILAGVCIGMAAVQLATAQSTVSEFRSEVIRYADLSEAEVAAMEKGELVVKRVKTANDQDVAVFGIVKIAELRPITMADFRESFSQRGNREMEGKGRFSDPPNISDLSTLTLEDRDFDELRKCRIGDCDINMSATWIRRFGTEIDWNAPDHRERATELFRAMVLEYASEYALKGATSLGTHANRKEPLDIARAQNELLKELPLVDTFAFGLRKFMQEFPAVRLSGIQSEMHWSAVDFGLNPTVTLTHAVAYTNGIDGHDSHFVLTRQFYSTRYLDASISLTALLRILNGNSVDSYMIFSDRSRSDALGGILGGVARTAVEAEAVDRVRRLLETSSASLTKTRAEQRPVDVVVEEEPQSWAGWLRANWLLASAALLVLLGLGSYMLVPKASRGHEGRR